MKTKRIIFLLTLVIVCISACKEEARYQSSKEDATPTGAPTDISYKPLYGGARLFYTIPRDENLISVNAEYTNERGDTYFFSSSFYKDSLDVIGFGEEKEYTVYLYGVNRAGIASNKVSHNVTPLEPAISRVAKSIKLLEGFSSFLLDWENELEQVVNVYASYQFSDNGADRDLISVFSSGEKTDRRFVENVNPDKDTPVSVTVWVEDRYGNRSENIDFGEIHVLEDAPLDKGIMKFPDANDRTVILRNGSRFDTGVPAMYGNHLEGRMHKLIDGVIDRYNNLNFFHTGGYGHNGSTNPTTYDYGPYAGRTLGANIPWNIIIDLGGYYELSRIVTHQRHSGNAENNDRGQYYRSENCGRFLLYYFDEDELRWVPTTEDEEGQITPQTTPIPTGVSELEFVLLGEAGDMAYMYPDNPQYTKPTRWFRYECLGCFDTNYTSTNANCMSELTIYGKKAN